MTETLKFQNIELQYDQAFDRAQAALKHNATVIPNYGFLTKRFLKSTTALMSCLPAPGEEK